MITIEQQTGFFAWLLLHATEASFMLIFGGMTLFFLLEPIFPRKESKVLMPQRWLSNIVLAIINFIIATAIAIGVSALLTHYSLGFAWLQSFDFPLGFAIAITIVAMEFLNYFFHRALHTFPWLWRLHAVHHSDIEIDVTTSHRHHPFEGIASAIFVMPIVLLLGAPIEGLLIYNALHTILALTSHANICLPMWLDRLLRPFIITPDFHRMHHIAERRYTDSNYGAIFPWFDYLFGTATRVAYEDIPQKEIGLEQWRTAEINQLKRLLILPFKMK